MKRKLEEATACANTLGQYNLGQVEGGEESRGWVLQVLRAKLEFEFYSEHNAKLL